jgi:hypothetical protein
MFLIQDYAPQYPGYYQSFKHAILLYTINELTGGLIYSSVISHCVSGSGERRYAKRG